MTDTEAGLRREKERLEGVRDALWNVTKAVGTVKIWRASHNKLAYCAGSLQLHECCRTGFCCQSVDAMGVPPPRLKD
jgi:hypothetical protein